MAQKIDPDDTETRNRWGSFLSRAASTLGDVKDAVVRGSQIGKIKIDTAFLLRERERLLRELGESVFLMVEEGRMTLGEEHEALLQGLREFQARILEQDQELAAVEAEAEAAAAEREAAEHARAREEADRTEASAAGAPVAEAGTADRPLTEAAITSPTPPGDGGRKAVGEVSEVLPVTEAAVTGEGDAGGSPSAPEVAERSASEAAPEGTVEKRDGDTK